MKKTYNQYQRGSSLIGIALLILAMGFLFSGGLYLMQNYNVVHADQESTNSSKAIRMALDNFMAVNGRLPCPAEIDEPLNTANFGKEDCSLTTAAGVIMGTIPVRTLNLSDKQIVDGYGKRYVYAVTRKHTETMVDAAGKTVPRYDVYNEVGAITLKDPNNKDLSATPGQIVYLLMSPGADDRGAYDINGREILPCNSAPSGSDSRTNCDATNSFVSNSIKNFNNGADIFTHKFSFHANATQYRWDATAWPPCDGSCFAGTQSRTVTCRNGQYDEIDDGKCEGSSERPLENRPCALRECKWVIGGWSGC